jgi:hypothetical protein
MPNLYLCYSRTRIRLRAHVLVVGDALIAYELHHPGMIPGCARDFLVAPAEFGERQGVFLGTVVQTPMVTRENVGMRKPHLVSADLLADPIVSLASERAELVAKYRDAMRGTRPFSYWNEVIPDGCSRPGRARFQIFEDCPETRTLLERIAERSMARHVAEAHIKWGER